MAEEVARDESECGNVDECDSSDKKRAFMDHH